MSRATEPRPRRSSSSKGQEMLEGLRELVQTLKEGKALEPRFRVHTWTIAPPPTYGGDDVRRVRRTLAMSQASFAAFLGTDSSTVSSWERGLRPPCPMACRLLAEIEADPAHWRRRLAASAVRAEPPDAPGEPGERTEPA